MICLSRIWCLHHGGYEVGTNEETSLVRVSNFSSVYQVISYSHLSLLTEVRESGLYCDKDELRLESKYRITSICTGLYIKIQLPIIYEKKKISQ